MNTKKKENFKGFEVLEDGSIYIPKRKNTFEIEISENLIDELKKISSEGYGKINYEKPNPSINYSAAAA